MKKWNTEKMMHIFSDLNCNIEIDRHDEGDHYSPTLILSKNGEYNLFITGFRTDNFNIITPDNCEIEMIELTDGKSSEGGLNSYVDDDIQFYADVRKKLSTVGITIVNSLKAYF